MSEMAKTAAALLDAAAPALGLTVETAWRPSIETHLVTALTHAANLLAFPLADEAEPAPVFEA